MTDIIIGGTRCEMHLCITCGVVYVVPSVVIEHQRKVGGFHYCSNGHSQGWDKNGDTEMTRLTRERDRLKQNQARLEEEKAALAVQAERATHDLARHKKRAAAGTCPCCRRNFSNMARHMKSKHPEFASDNVVKIEGRAK